MTSNLLSRWLGSANELPSISTRSKRIQVPSACRWSANQTETRSVERVKGCQDATVGAKLDRLLQQRPCELIVICLPPQASRQGLRDSLRAAPGLRAVLVEKPAAATSQAAAEAFLDLPVPVFIFHQLRLLPWAEELKRWWAARHDEQASIKAFCYGKLFDQGLHVLDLGQWVAGGLPEQIDHVLKEDEPGRLSARSPLPASWRLDEKHPGPIEVQVDARWDSGLGFELRCGPAAADGWLGKGLRLETITGEWVEFTTGGLKVSESLAGSLPTGGTVSDYPAATAEAYAQIQAWLKGSGAAPTLPQLSEP